MVSSLTNGANGGEPVMAKKPAMNSAPDTGTRRMAPDTSFKDRLVTVASPLGFMALVLLLGLYIPPSLSAMLHDAAAFVSVTP